MQARTGNIIGSLGFAALSAWILLQSAALDDRAAIFPRVAAGLILIGAVLSLGRSISNSQAIEAGIFDSVSWKAVSFVVCLFAIGLMVLEPVGFPLVAGVFFFAASSFLDDKPQTSTRIALHAVVALGFTALVTGLFILLLGVSLPLGLFHW